MPATLAVAARIVSRLPQYRGTLGLDDYVILGVWVSPPVVQSSSANNMQVTLGLFHGLDMRQYVLEEDHRSLLATLDANNVQSAT